MPYIGNTTSDFSIDTGNITNRAVTATKLSPSSVGSNGQVLSVDGSGNLQWGNDANAPEGTAVLSTGESGTIKYLRVDGDGTCSWQVPPDTQLSFSNDANNRIVTGTGSGLNGEANLTFDGSTLAVTGSSTFTGTVSFGGAGSYVGSNVLRFSPAGTAYIDHDVIDQDIHFRVSNTPVGSLGLTALVIKSTGNVGIGTIGPTKLLHLSGGSSPTLKISASDATPGIFLADANRTSQDQHLGEFQANWNGTLAGRIVVVAGPDTTNKDDGHMDFYTSEGGSNGHRIRIKHNGNVGIGTTSPGNKLHVAGITQIENGGSGSQGDAQLFIRKGSGTAAPESITRANSYLHLGGTEWGANAAGVYTLSFGYTNGTTGTNVPAYIGFKETSTSSYTQGDLVFGLKEGTSDVAPAEKLCIKSNGSINFSNTTIATKNTAGDIVIDFGNLTDNGGNNWRKCGVWILYNGIDTDATDNKSVIYYTGVGSVTTWNWVGDSDTLSNDSFGSVTLQNAAATSFRLYCDVSNQNTGSVTVLIHAWNTKPTITIN